MHMLPMANTGNQACNQNQSVLAFLHQKRVKHFSEFLLPHVNPMNANHSEKSSIVNSERSSAEFMRYKSHACASKAGISGERHK